MKFRLLSLLILLSFGASAQRTWTSYGANGIQRSTVPDTLFRSNGGASGFVYWRSDYWNATHFPLDANVVHKTGNETVSGIKQFATKLQVNAPNSNYQPSTSTFSVQKNNEGYGLFSGVAPIGDSWLQAGTVDDAAYYNLVLQPNGGNSLFGTTTDNGNRVQVNGNIFGYNNIYAQSISNLYQKRWVIYGDSFSDNFSNDYVGKVRDNLGLIATTEAVAGVPLSLQLAKLKASLSGNPNFLDNFDIISLHIGVNDFAGSVPLGSINSTIGDGTYSGDLKDFIETATTANPLLKVFIITPPEGNTVLVPYKGTNSAGWTLNDLSVNISQICDYYSIQCIDLYSLSGFNINTISTLTSDGLHPSYPVGTDYLGGIISQAFLSNSNKGRLLYNARTDQIFKSVAITDVDGGALILGKSGVGSVALLTTEKNLLGSGSTTDLNEYVYGNNSFSLWTNNVKRFVVDGSGNFDFKSGDAVFGGKLGIGTTSPVSKFVVSDGGANGLEVNPAASGGTATNILSYNRGSSSYTPMNFFANGFTFDHSVTAPSFVKSGASSTDILLGDGSTLPTTSLASVTNGSWTPASATVTLTVNFTYYQTVGNMTTAFFDITFPVSASGTSVQITGLPGAPYNYYPLTVSVNESGLSLYGETATTGGTIKLTDSTHTAITYLQMSGKRLSGSVTYRIP